MNPTFAKHWEVRVDGVSNYIRKVTLVKVIDYILYNLCKRNSIFSKKQDTFIDCCFQFYGKTSITNFF